MRDMLRDTSLYVLATLPFITLAGLIVALLEKWSPPIPPLHAAVMGIGFDAILYVIFTFVAPGLTSAGRAIRQHEEHARKSHTDSNSPRIRTEELDLQEEIIDEAMEELEESIGGVPEVRPDPLLINAAAEVSVGLRSLFERLGSPPEMSGHGRRDNRGPDDGGLGSRPGGRT